MSFRGNLQEPRIVETIDRDWTTSALNFYPQQRQGLRIVRMTIDNQDPTNNLTFNKGERGGRTYTVPPNSVALIENEKLSGVRVVPDGTTGLGQLSADMSTVKLLEADGFLGQA